MAPILPAVLIQYVKHENLLLEGRHKQAGTISEKGDPRWLNRSQQAEQGDPI